MTGGSREAGEARLEEFGPFQLLRLLGGGMGLVYLARQPALDRLVALKIVRHERVRDDLARARFAREARAAAALEHPGICPVYEVGEVGGVPYLCMRYVDGQTLAEKIHDAAARGAGGPIEIPERAGPPLAALLEVVAEVADALHAAHQRGLVHRDVKPSNVILDRAGSPTLLDFGLARDDGRQLVELTMTGQIVGTPAFLAPERLEPRGRDTDRRSDVYSLGATLYECLTLRCPFEAPSRALLFRKILAERPADPRTLVAGLPRDLAVVLDVALAKDPEDRFATAADFAADLRRIARGEPIRARPASPLRRARMWVRRNPLLALLVGTLCAAVALSSAGALAVRAERERALATRADLQRVALLGRIRQATALAGELEPPWPERIGAIERWLRGYGWPLRDLLPDIRARVVQRAAAAQEPDDSVPRYLAGRLETLRDELGRFVGGELADVERRLAWARTIAARSVDAFADRWRDVRAAVAAAPCYRGLELAPQLGLVPLGPDPASGLQEFYHLASAAPESAVPQRGADGRLAVREADGIVFVLLPGGAAFADGAAPRDPVELAPFFVGKHEVSRAQWARLAGGAHLSRYASGTVVYGELQQDLLPVDSATWEEAESSLRRFGLCLPTEVQWEYACRAGTATAWYTGSDPETLDGHANVRDRRFLALSSTSSSSASATLSETAGFDDGFVLSSPIGSFSPNRFGLCDMHGNLCEWCADRYAPSVHPPRAHDGLREAPAELHPDRVFRGGCWGTDVRQTGSARRAGALPAVRLDTVGVRAARRVL